MYESTGSYKEKFKRTIDGVESVEKRCECGNDVIVRIYRTYGNEKPECSDCRYYCIVRKDDKKHKDLYFPESGKHGVYICRWDNLFSRVRFWPPYTVSDDYKGHCFLSKRNLCDLDNKTPKDCPLVAEWRRK